MIVLPSCHSSFLNNVGIKAKVLKNEMSMMTMRPTSFSGVPKRSEIDAIGCSQCSL
jgi:hypothetical protein